MRRPGLRRVLSHTVGEVSKTNRPRHGGPERKGGRGEGEEGRQTQTQGSSNTALKSPRRGVELTSQERGEARGNRKAGRGRGKGEEKIDAASSASPWLFSTLAQPDEVYPNRDPTPSRPNINSPTHTATETAHLSCYRLGRFPARGLHSCVLSSPVASYTTLAFEPEECLTDRLRLSLGRRVGQCCRGLRDQRPDPYPTSSP